jgi:hypothetical protein
MNSNTKLISFLQLKPNSDKNINSIINETVFKLLSTNDLSISSDKVDYLIIDIEDFFIKNKNTDPIKYVNDFFKQSIPSSSDDMTINYDIISFDKTNTDSNQSKYHLMLINNKLNASTFVKNLSEDEQKKQFNLLASTLVSSYTNSLAIFGDVFLISINSEYYDLLLKIDEIEKKLSEIEKSDEIEKSAKTDELSGTDKLKAIISLELDKKNQKLCSFKNIYYDYNLINYLESVGSVSYVKIYEKLSNKAVYYSRSDLQNFVSSTKHQAINSDKAYFIRIDHEQKEIYIKYDVPLPSSHHSVISMIDNQINSNTNQFNSFYFVDLTKSDIIYLFGIK